MMQQINNSRNKSMVVDLQSTTRLLPTEQVLHTVDMYEQYLAEREASNKYRLVFNINPICSNVLFNPITEIVKDEGSDHTTSLMNYGNETIFRSAKGTMITASTTGLESGKVANFYGTVSTKNSTNLYREQAIRDTEYSHPDIAGFVYHCGMDIFSNVRLRLNSSYPLQERKDATYAATPDDLLITYNEGVTSPKYKTESYQILDVFNTIRDFKRNMEGLPKTEEIPSATESNATQQTMHLANNENISPFEVSYLSNLQERDGWFGFNNQTDIEIWHGEVGNKVLLNKIMNNNKACEQIDMYPDRSLYSFIPKINRYRGNREERNWDVCITYPYSSTTCPDYDAEISGGCDILVDTETGIEGIKIISVDEMTTDADNTLYVCRSVIAHNLYKDDVVELRWCDSYTEEDDLPVVRTIRATVTSLGDEDGNNLETRFICRAEDLDFDVDLEGNFIIPESLHLCKIVGTNTPCEYYFRIFRKVPNIKYLRRELEENELIKEADLTPESNILANDLGKQGFSRNIYGDQMSQLLFTDDIDTRHIRDNRNRPISEVYLTVLKRNAGRNEWYSDDFTNESIEVSHCFGEVTSGLDIRMTEDDYETMFDKLGQYNVHCLHNVNTEEDDVTLLHLPNRVPALEYDITLSADTFLGDIVEYNPYLAQETVLETVYHRFNTVQREYQGDNTTYNDIIYDNLKYDDYDYVGEEGEQGGGFLVQESIVNDINTRGNIFPEGYFYKPHYRIHLREFEDTVQQINDLEVAYHIPLDDGLQEESGTSTFVLETNLNEGLLANDSLLFRLDDKPYTAKIIKVEQRQRLYIQMDSAFYSGGTDEVPNDLFADLEYSGLTLEEVISEGTTFKMYIPTINIPDYASYVPQTGMYIWRNFKTFQNADDTDIKDAPFANDATYRETNITFFLRRQDPLGIYHLNYTQENSEGGTAPYKLCQIGKVEKIEDESYIKEEDMTVCS